MTTKKTGVLKANPVLKSTEGPTTRPCRLRFVNNFQYAIDIHWIDHEGVEKKYATIQTGGQWPQGTYTTHAWRIRESGSGRLLGTYVGIEATIEMTPAAACLVHRGFSSGYSLGKRQYPAEWGKFAQRGLADGIPIRAFECVSDKAVSRAEHLIQRIVREMQPRMLERLYENGADVAIIGRTQVVSDMPMHSFLKGQDIDLGGGRNCDSGTRGVGGSWTVPTCSVGEENLMMEDDPHYPTENILVHEFAHSVMAVGMDEDQRQAVISAYFNARSSQLYKADVYMLANADEYWAEGAQAWFEATIRTDVNSGINTRQKLRKHDPQLAALLQQAFGDGEWRYLSTAPADFLPPGTKRSLEMDDRLRLRAKAARYNMCCLPSWSQLQLILYGRKGDSKSF